MKLMLSVCIISKNEERWMAAFLEHLSPFCEEIILVDTGSTDRSLEIAREKGVRLFQMEWKDDFSLARNFSIEKATQPWVLILDPDERISLRDWKLLREMISNDSDHLAFSFQTRNYSENLLANGFRPCRGEYEEELGHPGYFEGQKVRLFRREKGIHFSGRVHELLEPSILGRIGELSIPIHHYGNTNEVMSEKSKSQFYQRISEVKARENSGDSRAQYEYGLSLLESGLCLEAATALEKARVLKPNDVDVLLNLGLAYLDSGQFENCKAVLNECLAVNPKHHGALFNLAVLEVREQNLKEAMKRLVSLLKIHPDSFSAYRIFGLCLLAIEKNAEAVKCFEEALRICPNFYDARVDLGIAYLAEGQADKAKKEIEQALHERPTDERALSLLSQLA